MTVKSCVPLLYEIESSELSAIKEINALLYKFNEDPRTALRYYLDNFRTVRDIFSQYGYITWNPQHPDAELFENSCDAHEAYFDKYQARCGLPKDELERYEYALLHVLDYHNELDEDVLEVLKLVLGIIK